MRTFFRPLVLHLILHLASHFSPLPLAEPTGSYLPESAICDNFCVAGLCSQVAQRRRVTITLRYACNARLRQLQKRHRVRSPCCHCQHSCPSVDAGPMNGWPQSRGCRLRFSCGEEAQERYSFRFSPPPNLKPDDNQLAAAGGEKLRVCPSPLPPCCIARCQAG